MNNKDDILNAAQKEKYSGKEAENHFFDRSILISAIITLIIGLFISIIEYFVKHEVNVGFIAIAFTAISVQMLYEGIKVKIVWKIILGAIVAAFALLMVIGYILQVVV